VPLLLATLLAALSSPSHHGFFLRMDLGVGYQDSRTDSDRINGPAAGFGISIGGNVADNLALFGTAVGGGTTADNPEATLGMFGFGLTYYFMPANVFLSGAVGFGSNRITENSIGHDTNAGIATRVGIGKEWFISDSSWGLGVAGYLNFSAAQDKGTNPPTWRTFAPLLAFSATFY
jgi:hypothetical protein